MEILALLREIAAALTLIAKELHLMRTHSYEPVKPGAFRIDQSKEK